MKKLTALTLSLAILGFGGVQTHAHAKKPTKKATSKVALSNTPTIEQLTAGKTTPQSPKMRSEITTTVTNDHAANLLASPIKGLPTPTVSISDIQNVPTIYTPANKTGTILLDTTLMDEFIMMVSPNARHYPPSFPNPTTEYLATQNVKHLSDWIEPYANAPDASFDIVLRAAKLNGIARNLNAGTKYSVRASNHMQKALQLNHNHPEANFLLGMMISEAGGLNEGKKYLEKAAALGYTEAKQSLAQSELLADNKLGALNRLKQLQAQHPDNTQIAEQLRIIESGGYYIWRSNDKKPVNIKPVSQE